MYVYTGAWTLQRLRQLEVKLSGTAAGLTADETSEIKLLREEAEKKKKEAPKKVDMMEAQPSPSHMAQSTLIRLGLAHYVITTNLDGIYRKAGLKAHTQLCCLHGYCYTLTLSTVL
jgi:NAD-dependent SIR2 family protein deacetylase